MSNLTIAATAARCSVDVSPARAFAPLSAVADWRGGMPVSGQRNASVYVPVHPLTDVVPVLTAGRIGATKQARPPRGELR